MTIEEALDKLKASDKRIFREEVRARGLRAIALEYPQFLTSKIVTGLVLLGDMSLGIFSPQFKNNRWEPE